MKPSSRAGAAGAVASVLTFAVLGAFTLQARADTEVVPGAPLPAPALVGPDDTGIPSPHVVRKTVTLDWSAVAGATGYRVEVGTDSTWSDAPVYTADVVYTQATLPLALPNATYFWRVAGLHGPDVGHWSSETGQAHSDANFVKGWREVPTLHAVTVPFVGSPSFSWSPVPEASGYEFQASTDPTFGAQGTATPTTTPTPDTTVSPGTVVQASPQPALFADCLTGRTRYTPAQDVVGKSDSVGDCQYNSPTPGVTVFWRVRALDAYTDAASGGSAAPIASEGVSYQGYKTRTKTPDLTSGCPQSVASASASASASTTPALSCTTLRPSIKASWSPVNSFTYTPAGASTSTAGPQVNTATLGAEDDGLCTVTNPGANEPEHATCTDMPTLHWTAVSGRPVYRVVVSLDDSFSNIQLEAETDALQWTMPGSARDGNYYYAVQACAADASSCGPVTTTPASFSKHTPRTTALSTPPVTGEYTLSWQSYAAALSVASGLPETQDAYAYHLEVATDASYSTVVDDRLVDHHFYTPTKSLGDGSFVYRVQAVDSKGDMLPWSLSRAFSRDATAPTIASVSPSSPVAVKQALTVVFSEPVTGVSSATLTLSPAATTTVSSVGDGVTFHLTPTVPLRPGASYVLHVASGVHDLAGNVAVAVGPTIAVNPFADDRSPAITYGGTWKLLSSTNALNGTFHSSIPTTSAQTTATMAFTGIGLAVTACMGPGNGYLDVYVDGVKKARVNLYRSYSGCGVKVLALTGLTRAAHTAVARGIGQHQSGATGSAVMLDAFTVTP